ncbi:hypothetical protein C8R44DRAFT_744148 [Mycena epipterygia]|nr:hypothetical protein C8R44DRAFT_744148 [Mycena epipterygia]
MGQAEFAKNCVGTTGAKTREEARRWVKGHTTRPQFNGPPSCGIQEPVRAFLISYELLLNHGIALDSTRPFRSMNYAVLVAAVLLNTHNRRLSLPELRHCGMSCNVRKRYDTVANHNQNAVKANNAYTTRYDLGGFAILGVILSKSRKCMGGLSLFRKLDFKAAREVKDSLATGILDNDSNNLLHRMGRNVQRNSNSVVKARAAVRHCEGGEEAFRSDHEGCTGQSLRGRGDNMSEAHKINSRGTSPPRSYIVWPGAFSSVRTDSEGPSYLSSISPPAFENVVTAAALTIPEKLFPAVPQELTSVLPCGGDLTWFNEFQFDQQAPAARIDDSFPSEFTSFSPVANSSGSTDSFDLSLDSASFSTAMPSAADAWDMNTVNFFDPPPSDDARVWFDESYPSFGSYGSRVPESKLLILQRLPSSPDSTRAATPPIEQLNADIDPYNIITSLQAQNPSKCVLDSIDSGVQTQSKEPKSRKLNYNGYSVGTFN